jgi:crotonobetainyl-CoA:carnitine CoA-transferase CaiB-like acyl-CoA transferase
MDERAKEPPPAGGGSAAPFRVLEIAGPSTAVCGRLLAEAGADVLKVEPPGGAPERRWPPLLGPEGARQSACSLYHDAGKRSITLDLETTAGRERLGALIGEADVALEGLPPGTLAAWGLGYETLRARQPGLVLVSITPFGQDGPYSGYAANDLVVFAMGGLMFISGQPGQPPVVAPDQQAWVVAGTHAALAALAVLWGRRASGEGDWVDVSAFECLAAQENTLTNYLGPGLFTRRNGSQHRTSLPGRIFSCRDGYLHTFIGRDQVWQRFLEWVGHPRELSDPALADVNVRWRHDAAVTAVMERFAAERDMAELYASAQAHHLPCVPVYSPAEFLADAQTAAREIAVEVGHPEVGWYWTLRAPLGLSAPPAPNSGGAWGDTPHTPRGIEEERVIGGTPPDPPGRGSPPAPPGTRKEQGGPLVGVRVCAFTHVAAGPYATLQLAYLGAEVIKVESRTRIDTWRYRDRNNDPERSRPFADHNKNVRSVLLNLKTAEGVELARRLIASSDAVLDNYSVGVMDRLGLGFEELRRWRSDVIVLHMAGLGATGPRRNYVTFGPSIMALCGMTHLWNLPGQAEPVGSQSSYPDYLVGVYAAYALVAALQQRARTGQAQLLDLAQAEAMACALGPSFVAALNGVAVEPQGNNSATAAPYGCYPCRSEAAGWTADDAWCVIAVETDEQWMGLRRVMDNPSWATAAELATADGRVARAAWLNACVANWTRARTPREVMQACQAHGVPAGMVMTGEDLAHDPHLSARGFLLEREHPRMGLLRMPGPPVRLQRQPAEVWRFGPLLGEDDDYVLHDVLGLSADEVRAYAERRALE